MGDHLYLLFLILFSEKFLVYVSSHITPLLLLLSPYLPSALKHFYIHLTFNLEFKGWLWNILRFHPIPPACPHHPYALQSWKNCWIVSLVELYCILLEIFAFAELSATTPPHRHPPPHPPPHLPFQQLSNFGAQWVTIDVMVVVDSYFTVDFL